MAHELIAQLRARSALLQHEARLEGDEPFTSELLDAAADEIERVARPWKVWSGGGQISIREDDCVVVGPLPGSIFSDGDPNVALLLKNHGIGDVNMLTDDELKGNRGTLRIARAAIRRHSKRRRARTDGLTGGAPILRITKARTGSPIKGAACSIELGSEEFAFDAEGRFLGWTEFEIIGNIEDAETHIHLRDGGE